MLSELKGSRKESAQIVHESEPVAFGIVSRVSRPMASPDVFSSEESFIDWINPISMTTSCYDCEFA